MIMITNYTGVIINPSFFIAQFENINHYLYLDP